MLGKMLCAWQAILWKQIGPQCHGTRRAGSVAFLRTYAAFWKELPRHVARRTER